MSFTARQSPEVLVDLIVSQIQTNIAAALTQVRTDRNDPRIDTQVPRDYFISETYDPYQCPAIFVVCEDVDWQKEQMGANFIAARAHVKVFCVVEDVKTEVLTRMTQRYEAALQVVLDQVSLTSANSKVKMISVVKRSKFSNVFRQGSSQGSESPYRKEVLLELDVMHYENF